MSALPISRYNIPLDGKSSSASLRPHPVARRAFSNHCHAHFSRVHQQHYGSMPRLRFGWIRSGYLIGIAPK